MHLLYTEQFSAIVSRVLNVKMCTKGTTRCEHFLKYLRVHAEGLGRLDALFFKKKTKEGRKVERKKELRRKERKEERKKGRKKERTKKERKKGGKEERKKERKN